MKENEENEVKNEEVKAEEVKVEEVKAEEVKPEVKEEVKKEVKKQEAKVENNFKQATTTETKPGFFKKHCVAIIISLLVIAAAAVAITFFIMNNQSGPEKVFNTYVEAMKEGNSDKIMDITDVKGAMAWSSCGRNPKTFIEKYNSITNEQADKYKNTTKTTLDSAMSLIKAFGGVEINVKNMEKPEDLGNGLFKVKGQITMKVLGMEQDQTISLVVYNGKYIGESYN